MHDVCQPSPCTSDPGGEGAAGDVLVVVLHQDAVVPGQHGQVGHRAGSILVVHAADVRLGRPLDGQGQTAWSHCEQSGQSREALFSCISE